MDLSQIFLFIPLVNYGKGTIIEEKLHEQGQTVSINYTIQEKKRILHFFLVENKIFPILS